MSEPKPLKLVVLISGEGSNFQAIQDAITAGSLNVQICLLISNRKRAHGLKRAARAGIEHLAMPPQKNESREAYDQRLIDKIKPLEPDLIVLAGFMRILSSDFIQAFTGRIINIHPSLLPAYKGMNTHQRVLDAGEKYHGASVHYVTEELDAGELILQSRIAINSSDNAASLQQRIHVEEHIIYPRAIQWISEQERR